MYYILQNTRILIQIPCSKSTFLRYILFVNIALLNNIDISWEHEAEIRNYVASFTKIYITFVLNICVDVTV